MVINATVVEAARAATMVMFDVRLVQRSMSLDNASSLCAARLSSEGVPRKRTKINRRMAPRAVPLGVIDNAGG